jgi:Ca2+-binding EF-hand superfamily protein
VDLGINIMEQEVSDMLNEVAKNGLIYFPEFCRVVLRKFREDDDEQFAQVMFKVGGL